jgi:multiple sugar transport system ATP-binding protein
MPPAPTGPAQLDLVGIEKSFGATHVLSGISLQAAPGEFIAMVGPSGCGKSTLLRIAAGLERPDRGRVLIAGSDVTVTRAADRDIAMVFQSYALYPHFTARQNMALPLAMRRLGAMARLPLIGRVWPGAAAIRTEIQAEVEQAAESLRITALLDRRPGQMSGGQRQRVALGRALVRHPKAFLMDEPLSNLDASLRVHMRAEIVELHRRTGVTTLYVTHDQEEALSMADRVAVMLGGRLLQVASPTEIYRRPAHVDVACFIGSPRINLLAARIAGGRAERHGHVLADGVAAPEGSAVRIGIRPEDVRLHHEARHGGLPVRVLRREFLGAEALLHLQEESSPEVLVARLSPAQAALHETGDTLHLASVPGAVLVFDEAGARMAHARTERARDAA